MGLGKLVFGLIRSVAARLPVTSLVQVARQTSRPTESIEEIDFRHHNTIVEAARQREEEIRRQEEEEYEEEVARQTPPKPTKTWKSHRDFLEHGGVLGQQTDFGCCVFGCGQPVPSDGGSVDMNDGRGPLASCVHGVEAVRIIARDWKGTELTRPLFYYSEKVRLRKADEEEADRQRIIKQEEERAAAREEQRQQQELEKKRLRQMEEAIVERCFEHHAVGTPKAGSCEMPGCDEKFALHRLYFAERVLWPDVGAQPVGRMHKLCQRHGHEARDVQHQKRAGIFWIFRDEQFATGYFKNRPIRFFAAKPTNGNGHSNGHNGSSMPSLESLARVERSKKGKPKTSTPQKKAGKLSGLLSREWNSKADIDRANELMRGAPPPPPPPPPKPNKKAKKGRKANGAQASA